MKQWFPTQAQLHAMPSLWVWDLQKGAKQTPMLFSNKYLSWIEVVPENGEKY